MPPYSVWSNYLVRTRPLANTIAPCRIPYIARQSLPAYLLANLHDAKLYGKVAVNLELPPEQRLFRCTHITGQHLWSVALDCSLAHPTLVIHV